MAQFGLHWSERQGDPDVKRTSFFTMHINRPRIAAETIVQLLTLKSKLLGEKLDIRAEAEEFEARNV